MQKDVFLLSDFPMIFSKHPIYLDDLINNDYLLPVSSSRIYYYTQRSGLELSFNKILKINSLLIYQADKYICGPNKEFLIKCIDYSKKLQQSYCLEELSKEVFNF
jgi:hypothetical protein